MFFICTGQDFSASFTFSSTPTQNFSVIMALSLSTISAASATAAPALEPPYHCAGPDRDFRAAGRKLHGTVEAPGAPIRARLSPPPVLRSFFETQTLFFIACIFTPRCDLVKLFISATTKSCKKEPGFEHILHCSQSPRFPSKRSCVGGSALFLLRFCVLGITAGQIPPVFGSQFSTYFYVFRNPSNIILKIKGCNPPTDRRSAPNRRPSDRSPFNPRPPTGVFLPADAPPPSPTPPPSANRVLLPFFFLRPPSSLTGWTNEEICQ